MNMLFGKEVKWVDEQVESCGDMIVISTPLVMKSAAGWYIGRLCKIMSGDMKDLQEPYDRLSDYMSYNRAIKNLQTINN
jgi:hypothetical protein